MSILKAENLATKEKGPLKNPAKALKNFYTQKENKFRQVTESKNEMSTCTHIITVFMFLSSKDVLKAMQVKTSYR
jgi:hypothetical protein